jgi:hypothetical protein
MDELARYYFQSRLRQYELENEEVGVDADDAEAGWQWAFDFFRSIVGGE